jgi:IclR family pca regulon transcriptional regulator
MIDFRSSIRRNRVLSGETPDEWSKVLMKASPYTIESLQRGLQVLALFSRENPALTLTEIKDRADLNKTTAFRIISTLETARFLERDPDTKRYRPGLKVLELGFSALSSLEFRQVARPYLEKLARQVGQTVSLSVLDGMEVIYIDRVRQQNIIGVMLGVGSRIPAHCASLGKAMLAQLPADILDQRLSQADLWACTPNTITGREELEADLARVRELGYAINNEEWVLGLRSTAAPILNEGGTAVAAVNISVSAAEMSREELEDELSPLVRTTALEVSTALGYMSD